MKEYLMHLAYETSLSLTSGSYRYEVHLSVIEMAYTPGTQMIFFLNLV